MELSLIAKLAQVINVPKVAEAICNYLTHQNNINYNKLEVALKAYGFTAQHVLGAIDSQKFLDTYRDTKDYRAIDAAIDVLKQGSDLSAEDKYKILVLANKSDITKQKNTQNYNLLNKIIYFVGIIATVYIASLAIVNIIESVTGLKKAGQKQEIGLNKVSYLMSTLSALLISNLSWGAKLLLPLGIL